MFKKTLLLTLAALLLSGNTMADQASDEYDNCMDKANRLSTMNLCKDDYIEKLQLAIESLSYEMFKDHSPDAMANIEQAEAAWRDVYQDNYCRWLTFDESEAKYCTIEMLKGKIAGMWNAFKVAKELEEAKRPKAAPEPKEKESQSVLSCDDSNLVEIASNLISNDTAAAFMLGKLVKVISINQILPGEESFGQCSANFMYTNRASFRVLILQDIKEGDVVTFIKPVDRLF